MAYQAAREGQPGEAVTLIDTAVVGVRGRETASLLAQLYSKQAYALAIMGDTSPYSAAISKARTEVERNVIWMLPRSAVCWRSTWPRAWIQPAETIGSMTSAVRWNRTPRCQQ
jgi:hypothetical protein